MYSENEQDDQMQMPTFDKKGDIKIALDSTAQKKAAQVIKQAEMNCQYNRHLDPFFRAEQSSFSTSVVKEVEFKNYFIKHKHRDQRIKVFEAMRELLIERGYTDISEIRDKQQEQIMVVRVIEKIQGQLNTVIIEDEHSKDKMVVKEGLVWLGMICAVKAKWAEGKYRLQKVIDLSSPVPQIKAHLTANPEVNRMLLIKGPFRAKFSNQDTGIRIIANQIIKFRKENVFINQLVVMGPILAKNNRDVQNFALTKTYTQQYETILAALRSQINKISPNIQIFVMPSLDDIVSLYPFPQPCYQPDSKQIKIRHLSNPCSLNLEGRRSTLKIDFINYDILKMIETHKTMGRSINNLRQQIMQAYIKQPFLLSNTISSQDAFDEVNLGNLFNNGEFGELVVFSSSTSPPFINQVGGRVVLNVGALGVDYHYTGKNFILLASIFQGDGPASQRMRIDTISQG